MASHTPDSAPIGGNSQRPATSDSKPRIQGDMGAKPLGLNEKTQTDHSNMTQFVNSTEQSVYMPVWMQRSMIFIFVMLCIEIGLVLSVLPWRAVWTDNNLMLRFPLLREIALNNFVRGMITGVGLLDIWIGVWDALHYRDHRPSGRN